MNTWTLSHDADTSQAPQLFSRNSNKYAKLAGIHTDSGLGFCSDEEESSESDGERFRLTTYMGPLPSLFTPASEHSLAVAPSQLKCKHCVSEGKKCQPAERMWSFIHQDKCERCSRLGYTCGPPEQAPQKYKERPTSSSRYHSSDYYDFMSTTAPFLYSKPKEPLEIDSELSKRRRPLAKLKEFSCQDHRCDKTFLTQSTLERHLKSVHGRINPGDFVYVCRLLGCPSSMKAWTRKDNFIQHVVRMHGDEYRDSAEDWQVAYDPNIHCLRASSRRKREDADSQVPLPDLAWNQVLSDINVEGPPSTESMCGILGRPKELHNLNIHSYPRTKRRKLGTSRSMPDLVSFQHPLDTTVGEMRAWTDSPSLDTSTYHELSTGMRTKNNVERKSSRELSVEMPRTSPLDKHHDIRVEVTALLFSGSIPEPSCSVVDTASTAKSTRLKVHLSLQACLKDFLKDSMLQSLDTSQLNQFITLTGELDSPQALTIGEYLKQTWPGSSHLSLALLENLLFALSTGENHCELRDQVESTATQDHQHLLVVASGDPELVCDLVQQLIWLIAALRPKVYSGISSCLPRIQTRQHKGIEEQENADISLKDTNVLKGTPAAEFVRTSYIDVEFVFTQDHEQATRSHHGRCWESLFADITLIRGFPVASRPEKVHGLEMSLEVMGHLVGTGYINEFDQKVFIKGDSKLMAPTRLISDVLQWHLCSNSSSDQCIDYDEHGIDNIQNIDIKQLRKLRHIVGWCDEAEAFAGTTEISYDAKPSRLNRAQRSHVLGGHKLNIPIPIPQSAPIIVPSKLSTEVARCEEYPSIFKRLNGLYVLLFDVSDLRGYLVDGVTGLLHLILASLKIDEKQSHGSDDFLFKWTGIKRPRDPYGIGAARRFLGSQHNRSLKLFTTRDQGCEGIEYELLSDRMVRLFHVLDKARVYQKKFKSSTLDVPRSRLEGWDFYDLASQKQSISARTTGLGQSGKSWVDLIRSLGAVTLFAKGLGDLIRPTPGQICCAKWSSLPSRMNYIAVRNSDIKDIIDLKGDAQARPPLVTRKASWIGPRVPPEHCGCVEHSEDQRGFVQTIWPKSGPKLEIDDGVNVATLPNRGATIFGYNDQIGWHWTDSGPPQEGPPPHSHATLAEECSDGETSCDSAPGLSSTGSTRQTDQSSPPEALLAARSSFTAQLPGSAKTFGDSLAYGGNNVFGDSHTSHNYYFPPDQVTSNEGFVRQGIAIGSQHPGSPTPHMLIGAEGNVSKKRAYELECEYELRVSPEDENASGPRTSSKRRCGP